MKITVSTLGCDAGKSGIGRYIVTLLEHWVHGGLNLAIYGHDSERASLISGDGARYWKSVSEIWRRPVPSVLWHQAVLPRASCSSDVLFLPAANRRLPVYHSVPSVGTVHDCSSLHVENKYDAAREFYIRQVLPWLMQKLDHVITVSESTKTDLVDYCGIPASRITVIPLAADHLIFFPRDKAECRVVLSRKHKISQPFLLYVSRIEHPGKNHVGLIHAFEILKQTYAVPHDLVFVGPERERSEQVHEVARRSPCSGSIRFIGPVPGDDLPVFYNAAEVFVLPSLYEGFGLPILEAMASKTPVSCSDRSSLPEVAGGCATTFNPYDEADVAEAILRLLQEDSVARLERVERGFARSAQFTWNSTSDRTLEVLQRVASGGSSSASDARALRNIQRESVVLHEGDVVGAGKG